MVTGRHAAERFPRCVGRGRPAMLSALAGGTMLGARFGGSPARVIALHGWRRTHADFDAVLDGLDAVAPDLPGFGATASPASVWGSADYAAALDPLVDECDGDRLVVVGHSFGGKVAVQLAARRGDRVDGVVLTGVPLAPADEGGRPRTNVTFLIMKRLNRLGVVSDERIEARKRASGSDDYRAATGVMRDILVRSIAEVNDGTLLGALERVTCPVEFLWGERDTAAPTSTIPRAVARCGGATNVTCLPGVGHMTPTEAPEALRAAIERSLAS